MRMLNGGPGTVIGLLLRLGQFLFSVTSAGLMCSAKGFGIYTAFCFLIAAMGLQGLWSLGLACLDVYALKKKRHLQNPAFVGLFVIGDWITTTLSFAAVSSSAGVMVLFARDIKFCSSVPQMPCLRFQLSIAMGFISWFLISLSSLIMFWLFGSL